MTKISIFEIEAEANRFTETIKFKDSPENTSFYEYIRFIRKKSEEVRPIRQELNDPSISDERRDLLREKSEVIDHEVKDKREAHIEKFPDCVFSMVLKNHREIPMPETVVGEDGKPDHDASYREYKKKYWQYIDFDDERILRTPVYHSKLKNYFENIVIKHPDTVKREADRIIDSTRGNNEIFEYTVWFLTNKYERSQIMGLDAVFVYLVENYYKTGEVFWLDDDRLNNIIERAKRLKPTLIGKTAPDIKMYLPDKSPKNLHDVEAKYTVIYFWDTECPHCKTKTPKLKDLYEKYKNYGLKIFAVNTQTDSEKWLNYVEKNNLHDWVNVNDARNKSGFRDKYDIYSIPLVFLLDENKKIIAKHIGIEQVQEIISRDLEEK